MPRPLTEKPDLRGAEKQFPQYLTRRSGRPSESPTSSFRSPRYRGTGARKGETQRYLISSHPSNPFPSVLLYRSRKEFRCRFHLYTDLLIIDANAYDVPFSRFRTFFFFLTRDELTKLADNAHGRWRPFTSFRRVCVVTSPRSSLDSTRRSSSHPHTST